MLNRLKGKLKIYRWWDAQLPLMMALVYYEVGLARPILSVVTVLRTLALFLVSSIGIATFGYLLNDLTDREKDRRSGVSNLLANKGRRKVAAMFIVVMALSWSPWFWLPKSVPIICLLVLEYLLFIAYSVPPVRLKERGAPGSAADALYGYTIPMMVAMLLFAKLGSVSVLWRQSAIIAAWSFILGFRHILVHQLKDVAHDEVSGTQTTVTTLGWDKVFRFIERKLLPSEASLFVVALLVLGARNVFVPVGFVVYAVWSIVFQSRTCIWRSANPWRLPEIDKVMFICITLMSRFQLHWLPFLMLPILIYRAPIYIVIAVLHLFLFENGYQPLFQYELPELRRIRRIHTYGGTC